MKKLLFTLFILIFFNANAQEPKLSNSTTVSIFTCGSGAELYSTFGHTAIRIQDITNKLDVVYNYGTFDFTTENFYLKFVKGDLQYFVTATTYEDFILEYQYTNREVIEQTIILEQEKKQQLFDLLNKSLQSDEKFYTYKFIDRNCTTMVVDKLNAILGTATIQKVDDKSVTYREVLYPYFENYFCYKLGINIIFGAKTDKKAEKLFLPIELLNSIDKVKVKEKSLLEKKEMIVASTPVETEFSFFNSIYFVITLLLLLLFINNKIVSSIYLFIAGLLGIFLCAVGLYSQHQEVLWNYNALLFNPFFVLIPFVKNKKFIYLLLLTIILYSIFMINKVHLPIMLPFIISHFILLTRFIDRDKTKPYLTFLSRYSNQEKGFGA